MLKTHGGFLRDIFLLSVTAFGGPQAHIAMFLDLLVAKRKYLTDKELLEINAFSQLLPGPSSTQTIIAIAMKRGGVWLALISLLIWSLPAVVIMSGLSFLMVFLGKKSVSLDFLKFVHPLAIGLIAASAFRFTTKITLSRTTVTILILSSGLTIMISSPWIFPILLIGGGVIACLKASHASGWKDMSLYKGNLKVPLKYEYIILFLALYTIAGGLGLLTNFKPVVLFENFYRFGSLVYGGGNVLIPMMYEQFVQHREYMTTREFISGIAFGQAMPGPVFSFTSYLGGIAMKDMGYSMQLLGCLIGTIAIFLPGTLLMFFALPLWEHIKTHTLIQRSIEGINAAAAGLVVAVALILFQALEMSPVSVSIVMTAMLMMLLTRVPSPLMVVAAVVAGLIF